MYRNPKQEYQGRFEDYPMSNYPDYVPGQAPNTQALANISYLDELERIWGKRWGAQGIGKLREVALIKPTEHEVNPLWEKYRDYFLLRREKIDLNRLQKAMDDYGELLTREGVTVHWMEAPEKMGAYGPMRKLFMGAFPLVVNGGAIMPRLGHGSFLRGLEVNFFKFFGQIGCPILLTVHGMGVAELGPYVRIADDAILAYRSVSCNDEALEQILPVLRRAGYKEIPIANCTTVYQDYKAGGEFHPDMFFATLDLRLALIYPAFLDYQVFKWLKERDFKLIEGSPEEHSRYTPENLLTLEPGRVIMPSGAKETIHKVRQAGVEVIEFDTSGLQVGTNGIACVTLQLIRDKGPSLSN